MVRKEESVVTKSTSFFTDTNNCDADSMSGRQSIEVLADFVQAFLAPIAQQVIQPDNAQ